MESGITREPPDRLRSFNRDPEEFAGEGVDFSERLFSELRRRARAADEPARRSRLDSLTRASSLIAMA